MRGARLLVAKETPRQQDGGAAGRLAGPVVSLGSWPFCSAKSSGQAGAPAPAPRPRGSGGQRGPRSACPCVGGAEGGLPGRGLGAGASPCKRAQPWGREGRAASQPVLPEPSVSGDERLGQP
ncbi:hypothetical protein NN561_013254 [Cricetulus griseus]